MTFRCTSNLLWFKILYYFSKIESHFGEIVQNFELSKIESHFGEIVQNFKLKRVGGAPKIYYFAALVQ